MNLASRRAALIAVLVCGWGWFASSTAPAATMGVIGDSLSDEYGEESYSYADNWVEQLVAYRGIDFGPTGKWGGSRRNFYEYNWARSGANSTTMLSSGQHTGLAAQVVPKGIDYAVLMIGANDQFDSSNAYQNIFSGTWNQTQINNWANGIVNRIDTALSTVVPTGVKLVLFGSPDYGITPSVRSQAFELIGRQRVALALSTNLNPKIKALAEEYQLPYVDLLEATEDIYGPHKALKTTLTVGNVNINLQQLDNSQGTNLNAGFVHDGIHPHTVVQGLIANLAIEALNIGYGAQIPLFSEQELLAHRGIAYGGSDTLASQIGPYSSYITNYAVPEPSTLALSGIAIATLVVAAVRRRRTI